MASINLEDNQRSTDHAKNRPVDDGALQDDPSTPGPSTFQHRQTSPRQSSRVFTDPFADRSGEPKQTPNGLPESRHSYGPSSLTPAARTGPPRSLSFSYNYTIPSSFSTSSYINRNTGDILEEPTRPRALTESDIHDDPSTYDVTPRETKPVVGMVSNRAGSLRPSPVHLVRNSPALIGERTRTRKTRRQTAGHHLEKPAQLSLRVLTQV